MENIEVLMPDISSLQLQQQPRMRQKENKAAAYYCPPLESRKGTSVPGRVQNGIGSASLKLASEVGNKIGIIVCRWNNLHLEMSLLQLIASLESQINLGGVSEYCNFL